MKVSEPRFHKRLNRVFCADCPYTGAEGLIGDGSLCRQNNCPKDGDTYAEACKLADTVKEYGR